MRSYKNLKEIQKTWEKFWKNKLQPCNKLNRCAQKKNNFNRRNTSRNTRFLRTGGSQISREKLDCQRSANERLSLSTGRY